MVRAFEYASVRDPRGNAALSDIFGKEVMILIPRIHSSTFWCPPARGESGNAGQTRMCRVPARDRQTQATAPRRRSQQREKRFPRASTTTHATPQVVHSRALLSPCAI